jgi:hypothetical protein
MSLSPTVRSLNFVLLVVSSMLGAALEEMDLAEVDSAMNAVSLSAPLLQRLPRWRFDSMSHRRSPNCSEREIRR